MNAWNVMVPTLGAALIAVFLGWRGDEVAAQQADPAAESKDIEILGYGAIHEAFAQPASPTLDSAVAVSKKPPQPVEELPPDVKPEGDNVIWIGGYWAFDNERDDFVWITGFWRNVPPNRVWVGGYWATVGAEFRWVPGFWSEPSTTQTYYPPPPEVIVEAPPPAPDENSYYVAGTWVYRDTRYLWRPGFWTPYRAGWLWTQPRYSWTPGGYVFIDGYWDYDFNRRGVLFAPAYFGPAYFGSDRVYRPSYALSTELLYASLFVRPNQGFYYFGDYYAPRYANLGFTPWLDYRYRGRYADPAWSYYAWQNRATPRFREQMQASYASRQRGDTPAPPRRIAAQENPKQSAPNAAGNLVVPLPKFSATNNIKLRPVTKDELKVAQAQSSEARALAKTRIDVESKIDSKATQQQPQKANFALPPPAGGAVAKTAEPPPALTLPKTDPRVAPPKAKDPTDPRDPPAAPPVTPPKLTPPKLTPPKVDPPKIDPQPPLPPTKNEPKTVPAPPVVPSPKVEPKTNPVPPSPVPLPKQTPPPPKFEPKTLPAPVPKAVPPVAQPVPSPMPKAVPQPAPQPAPIVPKAIPTPAPKAAAPQPVPPPPPAPRIERPAPPQTPPGVPKDKKETSIYNR